MGRDNIKKSYRSSLARLALYRNITIGINGVWLLATLFLYSEENGGGYGFGTWFGLCFWAIQELAMIFVLQFHFSPKLDPSGNVLDCNDITDTSTLGYFSYAQDVLFVCWFVQTLSLLTRYAYIIYLIVPLFVGYKAVTLAGPHVLSWLLRSDDASSTTNAQGSRLAQRRAEAGKRRF